jgi:peroxiredoxin
MSDSKLLGAGDTAPDFTLTSGTGDKVTLSSLRGKNVVLAFYPADFSSTCSDQMGLYGELLPEFEKFDAAVLGISVDNTHAHKAFAEARNIGFPLLADFEPKGAVAKAYGCYLAEAGTAGRAQFVLDKKGVISWSHMGPNRINPGAEGILAALESLAGKKA